jgi:hypothetical protein
MTLFAVILFVSRFGLPPVSNVNYAVAMLPGWDHPLIEWVNGRSILVYLAAHLGGTCLLVFLPTAVMLRPIVRIAGHVPGVGDRHAALFQPPS